MEVRKPVVAGAFYPYDKEELIEMLDNFFSNVDIDIALPSNIKGVLVPHAGYIFSGQVAAYSYSVVKELKPEIVVILGPSHRERIGGSSVAIEDYWETPLGRVPIAKELAYSVVNEDLGIYYSKIGHSLEHSLEVQLPFLQYVLNNNFKIIPISIGDISLDHLQALANQLKEVLASYPRVLYVISSDLSHYHSYYEAKEMDLEFLRLLESGDYERLYKAVMLEEVEACGIGPIFTMLFIARHYKNLIYMNSGDTFGDKIRVVGYAGGVFYD